MHTRAHTSHCKVSEDVLYENKSESGKMPPPASQTPHGEDAQNCGDCTASMIFSVFLRNRQQTQVLPKRPQRQPPMYPVLPTYW